MIGPPDVLSDLDAVAAILPAWRQLAHDHARSPFDAPDWLFPLAHRYLSRYGVRFLAWHRAGELVAVAPLSLVADQPRLRPIRQLAWWGAIGPRMRGLVDVVARDELRTEVLDSLCDWLRANREWELVRVALPQVGSATPDHLRVAARQAGWSYVGYANVRSMTFQLDLPASPDGWQGMLNSRIRRNMGWQRRRFAAFRGGALEAVVPEGDLPASLDVIERLLASRWGDQEVYFRAEPSFRPLVGEAVAAMARAGTAWVSVARDEQGVQAGLVTLAQNGYALSLLVAATTDPLYRPFSLGTHVFDAGIGEAVRRGCHTYDFLWMGSYKQDFWHAQPRLLESAVIGRGWVGRAAARWLARREGRVGQGRSSQTVRAGNAE